MSKAKQEVTDSTDDEPVWEGVRIGAAADFAHRCRELCDSNPYGPDIPPPLNLLMGDLATSLWDESFSQSEIRAAFERRSGSAGSLCGR
jgi:hypothetical protein